ncbi:MAG: ABC transporter ATP-binding protein [Clostridium sp.]|nr:ABC transporter ATP-binding protein [Clostridium sp.]MCM1398596.1 ABC transporter ATP-binding protein [Clostridium sp.]MCM1459884.1 ABC transporter ATP-binding protein [Bacteroides sp.]
MIELQNISKTYKSINGKTDALSDVSLTINEREFVCIMGKSGSGKTTLLNIIGCMDQADSGEYCLDTVSVGKLSANKFDRLRREKISFIFPKYELMSRYTVYENIELPMNAKKISRKEKKQKIADIMKRLGIYELRDKFPKQLSGGEQQRVAIARAYVSDNKYILADEPTGALDNKNTQEIMNIFGELRDEGKTIVLVTHDEEIAMRGDRIVYLLDGKIMEG